MGVSPISLISLLLQAAFLICGCSSAVIAPRQTISLPPDSISLNLSTSNSDPRFQLETGFGEDRIDITGCLMNTVNGLADLAHEDFEERVPQIVINQLPDYQNVEITIKPVAPANDVEIRVAIWGLFYTVLYMLENSKFYEAESDLFWEEVLVANLIIESTPSGAQQNASSQASGLSSPANEELSFGGNSTAMFSNDTLPFNNDNLHNYFQYQPIPPGVYIPSHEVFLAVMTTLKNISPHASGSTISSSFRSGAIGHDFRIDVLLKDRPTWQELATFQYGYVTDTVRKIPAYFMEHNKWATVWVGVVVGVTVLGHIELEAGDPSEPGAVTE